MHQKRRYFLLLLLISTCWCYSGNAQHQSSIELYVENAPTGKYLLKQIKGQTQIQLQEAIINGGKVVFTGHFESGLYGILKDNVGVSFIVNEPTVSLQTDWKNSANVFKAIHSKENEYWIGYMKKRDEVFNKINLLHPITIGYDRSSPFYEVAIKEFYEVQDQLNVYLESIPKNTLAYQFIQADLRPALAHDKGFGQQKEDLKSKWFEGVNWQEERLLNSDILTNKIDDFMGLYADKSLGVEQQEAEFKKGIDAVLSKTTSNPKVHEFVLGHFVKKLEQFGMENVILHIAENYANNGDKCEKESSDSEIINRLKKYELLQIGKIAPSISSLDLNGNRTNVLKTLEDKNLLVFWSSRCTHCRQMMPNLQKWYNEAKISGWSLITISLDKEKQDLTQAVEELKLDFPIYSDYQGWKSNAALDYNVSATPAMFVLDKDRKIIGKPNWVSEVEKP